MGGLGFLPQLLDYVARQAELDVIAIADLDEFDVSYRAWELARRAGYPFEVVKGMEVSTQDGYLLALFLKGPVSSGRPMAETIKEVRAQGGLSVVAHPMSWLEGSIGQGGLDRLLSPASEVRPDGLEILTVNMASRGYYGRAQRLNEKRYHLAEVGSSDACHLSQVGQVYTLFPGQRAADLKKALLEGTTRAERAPRRREPSPAGPWLPLSRASRWPCRLLARLRRGVRR